MQGQAGVRASDGQAYCSSACAKSAESKVSQAIQEVYLEDEIKGPAEEPASMEHTGEAPIDDPDQTGHGSGTSGGTSAPRVPPDPGVS
jgi:hypothetical protein